MYINIIAFPRIHKFDKKHLQKAIHQKIFMHPGVNENSPENIYAPR